MPYSQPTFRSVRTVTIDQVTRDAKGRLVLKAEPNPYRFRTRAVQPTPRFDRITPVIAVDCEFQQVYIEALGKHRHRVGRVSIVNYEGDVIYDVFAWYPDEPGMIKKLSPKRLRLGVYAPDIKLSNGACPIQEVEYNVEEILRRAEIVVGHSIANDVKVFSLGMFKDVQTRDTQKHEAYRVYGKGPQRLPKLAVLAARVLGKTIQGDEHSSVEDAQATMELYRHQEYSIERTQGGNVMCDGEWDAEDYFDDDELEYQPEDAEEELLVQTLYNFTEKAKLLPPTKAAVFWQGASSAIKSTKLTATPEDSSLKHPTASQKLHAKPAVLVEPSTGTNGQEVEVVQQIVESIPSLVLEAGPTNTIWATTVSAPSTTQVSTITTESQAATTSDGLSISKSSVESDPETTTTVSFKVTATAPKAPAPAGPTTKSKSWTKIVSQSVVLPGLPTSTMATAVGKKTFALKRQ